MDATYAYDNRGLLTSVTYSNGAKVEYDYDNADRLTSIKHLDGVGAVANQLTYTYQDNDLIKTISDTDGNTTFFYSADRRLTSEVRGGSGDYDWTYSYDGGGNRIFQTDLIDIATFHVIGTDYVYDYEDPVRYGSDNNRLMWLAAWEFSFSSAASLSSETESFAERIETPADLAAAAGVDPRDESTWPAEFAGMTSQEVAESFGSFVLLYTTWYYYNLGGNVTHVVTNNAGTTTYTASRMVYAKNEQTVAYGMGESWIWTGTGNPTGYTVDFLREFRYDESGAKYLNRELDPTTFAPIVNQETWSDYHGDQIYGDFTVDGLGNVTEKRSFEPGIAKVNPWREKHDWNTKYYHADHVGTTRHLSDDDGDTVETAVYTAFGDHVFGTDHRYGYVGTFGYGTDDTGNFPFLQVGQRYYDPSSGRFLQRDPLGLRGARNVYVYVENIPSLAVDPTGELLWIPIVIGGFLFIDSLASPAEAPSPWDSPDDFRQRQEDFQNDAIKEVAISFIPLALLCKAAGKSVKKIGPSANPPAFKSPFGWPPKGPFYGGGQLWPPESR